MANKLDIKINLPTDAELKRMFDAVPMLEKYRVGDQVVRAGCRPVVKRARQLAPRGDRTGTSKKRSKKQKSEANWDIPLWKTISFVFRKYRQRGVGVVGPKWPEGNKAYFNTSPKGNAGHQWGYPGQSYPKSNGGVHVAAPRKPRAQIRNWIVQAFDETKSEQLAAMKKKLVSLMDEAWKSG